MSTEPRRLLDVHASARYLGDVSVRVVHELRAAGHLRPVRLPLAGDRELRKLLFDVRDLDAFIEALAAEFSAGPWIYSTVPPLGSSSANWRPWMRPTSSWSEVMVNIDRPQCRSCAT